MEITKDSKKLLSMLYIEYLKRVDRGINKADAMEFGDYNDLIEALLIDWPESSIEVCCRELKGLGLLAYEDTMAGIDLIELTSGGIAHMEKTKSLIGKIEKAIDAYDKLKP